MEAFVAQGHSVMLLTQASRGLYHEACEKKGVKTFAKSISKNNSLVYFFRHAIYLTKFCRRNKIEVVYSHLENASLPAVLAQYFIKADVIACRHIIDEAFLMGSRKFIFLNKIVYSLAREIIVVSNRCKEFMTAKEKINPDKIKVIGLGYNFDLYDNPDPLMVNNIRKKCGGELLLLTACRLVRAKRPEISIYVVEKLRSNGINAKLIILGTGPMENELKQKVFSKNLGEHIYFPGFVSNVQDYLAACDLLLHPSIQDSSSVIIKEAGLNRKPVIACKGIGDVDDYLSNDENAFLVSTQDTETEMVDTITKNYRQSEKLAKLGVALYNVIIQRFRISNAIEKYDQIHNRAKLNEEN
jgi:glycosyltransferase involved in cell wall biosynthesis